MYEAVQSSRDDDDVCEASQCTAMREECQPRYRRSSRPFITAHPPSRLRLLPTALLARLLTFLLIFVSIGPLRLNNLVNPLPVCLTLSIPTSYLSFSRHSYLGPPHHPSLIQQTQSPLSSTQSIPTSTSASSRPPPHQLPLQRSNSVTLEVTLTTEHPIRRQLWKLKKTPGLWKANYHPGGMQ